MPRTYIALGSNIDPEDNLKAASILLREKFPDIRFSSVYRTAPLEHTKQADFLNATATFESAASPEEILLVLSHIELHLKKNPPFRFGPRTIDLDLLLYGDTVLSGALTIPHPRMHERRFVLEPLNDLLDPQTRHPVLGKTWAELLQETIQQNVTEMKILL